MSPAPRRRRPAPRPLRASRSGSRAPRRRAPSRSARGLRRWRGSPCIAPATASARSAKSPPLYRPPTIARTGPSKAWRLFRAASTLVALESLKKRTPSHLGHQLEDVLHATEGVDRAGDGVGGGAQEPRGDGGGQQVAGEVGPRQPRLGPLEERLVDLLRERASTRATRPSKYAEPSRLRVRGRSLAGAEQDTSRASAARASPSRPASSAFTTAQSSAVWLRKMRAFGPGVVLEARVAVQMVGGEVQEDRHLRPEASRSPRAGSSTTSTAKTVPGRRAVEPARPGASPMFPPDADVGPASMSIAPRAAVVVDFPLVPVTAATVPTRFR